MSRAAGTAGCCTLLLMALPEPAAAQEPAAATGAAEADAECECDDGEYGEQNAFELGGTMGFLWNEDSFTLDLSPTVGYFIVDYVELSAFIRVEYENQEDEETGERVSTKSGAVILEPSYHVPIAEGLFVFGGLGLGAGYDGDDFDFEVIPRTGLNIGVGRSGELTLAARVPIITDPDETTVGVGFEAGYTVVW